MKAVISMLLPVTYSERAQLKIYGRIVRSSFSMNDHEAKVLLFMLDRTIGWRKAWESISMVEFENGIFRHKKGKDVLVTRGTSLPSAQIRAALTALLEAGAIEIAHFPTQSKYRINPEWLHPELPSTGPLKMWEASEGEHLHDAN